MSKTIRGYLNNSLVIECQPMVHILFDEFKSQKCDYCMTAINEELIISFIIFIFIYENYSRIWIQLKLKLYLNGFSIRLTVELFVSHLAQHLIDKWFDRQLLVQCEQHLWAVNEWYLHWNQWSIERWIRNSSSLEWRHRYPVPHWPVLHSLSTHNSRPFPDVRTL